jgi:hypothetical protein
MRPPILSDAAIRAAIQEVASQHDGRASGVAVRELLARRFGARGGVERIYRLLNESVGARQGRGVVAAGGSGERRTETREEASARADLAEHRERAHQARWARETDELRRRLAAAEQAAHDAEVAGQRVAELTRALASAQARIAALETAARRS